MAYRGDNTGFAAAWTPSQSMNGGDRCDAAAHVYQWSQTTDGYCPLVSYGITNDIGDYLPNCDFECAKTACVMREDCAGMTQAVPVGVPGNDMGLKVAKYKLKSDVAIGVVTQASAGSSHTYSCWRRGHVVQSVPATVPYGPLWGQNQPTWSRAIPDGQPFIVQWDMRLDSITSDTVHYAAS